MKIRAIQETLFDGPESIKDFASGSPGFVVYTNGNDDYLTPPDIINRLGMFDLDPCSPFNRPWPTAMDHYTREMDGLKTPWFGRVWLNPPYGKMTGTWLKKLAKHGNGIALIFACTETKAFFETVWKRADAVLFIQGRIHFHRLNGDRYPTSGGAPSCLVAYGKKNVKVLEQSCIDGHLVKIKHPNKFTKLIAWGSREKKQYP